MHDERNELNVAGCYKLLFAQNWAQNCKVPKKVDSSSLWDGKSLIDLVYSSFVSTNAYTPFTHVATFKTSILLAN